MQYNGIELDELIFTKPVVFDPPKNMLVWDASQKWRFGEVSE